MEWRTDLMTHRQRQGQGRRSASRLVTLAETVIVGASMGIGFMLIPGATLHASAKTSHCLVINRSSAASYASLQSAADAAAADGTLFVRGTCQGDTTISKDLTLVGQQPRGFGAPTLDGDNHSYNPGHVLTIDSGATVRIQSLTITGGWASAFQGLTLGGGIFIWMGNVDVMDSTITDNYGGGEGGGVFDFGSLTLESTSVSDNTAGTGGGIADYGSVTMNGASTLTGNIGGGIADDFAVADKWAPVTMNDTSTITDNAGGGLIGYILLTMNDYSSVTRNTGGGFAGAAQSTVTMNGHSKIAENTADQGGGIFIGYGSVTMNDDSTITGNTATTGDGGGLYSFTSSVTMTGASTITSNAAAGHGGGIYQSIIGNGASLSGVSADNVYGNQPDDVYVAQSA